MLPSSLLLSAAAKHRLHPDPGSLGCVWILNFHRKPHFKVWSSCPGFTPLTHPETSSPPSPRLILALYYISLCLDLEKYFKHLSLIHQVLSLVSHLSMLVSIDLRENASLVKLPMYRTKVIIIYIDIYIYIMYRPR